MLGRWQTQQGEDSTFSFFLFSSQKQQYSQFMNVPPSGSVSSSDPQKWHLHPVFLLHTKLIQLEATAF